jgi:nitrite reductase/ring-hydroxylating ferredoxin subunit
VIADVGAVAEFEEARPRIVTVRGQQIGVVRCGDAFYAMRNRCPHMQAPLLRGIVEHNVCAGEQFGRLALEADRPVIGCPWHGWQFDLKTGESVSGAPLRVTTFRTQVEQGRVFVEIGGG